MGNILYGLVETQYINRLTNERIATSRTLINGGIEINTDEIDVRGGSGNKLIGRVFANGMFNVNTSDALFDFAYMKMALGGNLITGDNMIIAPEQYTISTANTITVTGTPVSWNGEVCGWYTKVGEPYGMWHKITFTGKVATVPGLKVGDIVCVQYNQYDAALKSFKLPATIIPDEVYLIMRASLFSAGEKTAKPSSKVGELIIEVPRFIFSANSSFSFDNAGASTTDLSGSALVNYDNANGCDSEGYYAIIKEFIPTRTFTEGLTNIVVNGNDVQLKVGETETLEVIGIYSDSSTGKIQNSDLTFTSSDSATASVTNAGVVSGVNAGDAYVDVSITSKPEISTAAKVTVSV